jgi:hypothetical protein
VHSERFSKSCTALQETRKIIDFHLVEKCRTKFRAFVKSYGARVKFEPVRGLPRKQEYHGTVTVNRACKQQWLTQHAKSARMSTSSADYCEVQASPNAPQQLQCAAPEPITTGASECFLVRSWPVGVLSCSNKTLKAGTLQGSAHLPHRAV